MRSLFGALFAGALLSACGGATTASTAPAEARQIVVHKSPTCGCCTKWEDHLREHGFDVASRPSTQMHGVKAKLGVPEQHASCHTAEIDGYVVEGHVPAAAVERLLLERPDAKGLAVPGMPLGSPGMEVDGQEDAYDVLLLNHDGTTTVFEHHPAS